MNKRVKLRIIYMSVPVENILETWAAHKQTVLDASFLYKESQQRVWNLLEQEISQKSSNGAILRSSNTLGRLFSRTWSILVPVGVVAAAIVLLVSYGDKSQPIARVADVDRPSVQVPKVAVVVPEESSSTMPATEPLVAPQQDKSVPLVKQRTKQHVVYAQPGQSVFVSWAVSVYTPVSMARSNSPVPARAVGVFTQ